MSSGAGIFPVDIEPVENTGCRGRATRRIAPDPRWQVALEEHCNTGTDESLPRRRCSRHIREVFGVRPAPNGKKDFEIGIFYLQFTQLVEVALDRLAPGIARPIDTVRRCIALLIVSIGITGPIACIGITLVSVRSLNSLKAGEIGRVDVLEIIDNRG